MFTCSLLTLFTGGFTKLAKKDEVIEHYHIPPFHSSPLSQNLRIISFTSLHSIYIYFL